MAVFEYCRVYVDAAHDAVKLLLAFNRDGDVTLGALRPSVVVKVDDPR